MVWKREKEINKVKFTNNISFPEARKIVQSQNNFPPKAYAQAATTNTEPKQHHSCQSCHTLLEKLSNLTPDTLPKFSLSEDKPSQPSTSQTTVKSQSTQPTREVAKQVAPPQTTQSPPSPVRQSTRSPNRGLRQSPTPRQRIQLEKTNSKNRFSVLEDEESMECGAPPSAPSSPTPEHRGKSPPQTPKPQRKKVNK